VPAAGSLPSTSFMAANPGVAAELQMQVVPARVRVIRPRGPISISVDLTQALKTAAGPGGELRVVWTLAGKRPKVNTALPRRVAVPSCLS
jgi:hypothetical protein